MTGPAPAVRPRRRTATRTVTQRVNPLQGSLSAGLSLVRESSRIQADTDIAATRRAYGCAAENSNSRRYL